MGLLPSRHRRPAEWSSCHLLEPYNAALAVVETQQHLDLLQATGRLRRENPHGVIHWSLASPARDAAVLPTGSR